MRKSNNKAINPNLIPMKKRGYQWEVAFGRSGAKPQLFIEPFVGKGRISIQRHVADLQIKILSQDTFKIGVDILKSLMQDRYSFASRFEQRQLYSIVSRVATILTTQFTGKEFWIVGLSLFKVAKKVITEIDELIHICACIDLSRKFLGNDRQRKEVLGATATVSRGPSAMGFLSKGHIVNHRIESINDKDEDDYEPFQEEFPTTHIIVKPIMEMEASDCYKEDEEEKKLQSVLNHNKGSHLELELDDVVPKSELEFPQEDPDIRLARILTMEELSMEIQAILYRVNQTFAGRNQALAHEFIGLQEAIQATLQEINNAPRGPPPAAKEEIEKLSIVAVTKHVLATLGEGTQCAVCREPLLEGDIMQEMPCLHPYHPECLKPWLEKHNSCPICRFELRTEDEDYERQKQQDHEAKEDKRHIKIALKRNC